MSKIILGLDLGTASIGHTILRNQNTGIELLQHGVHILPSNLDKKYITGSQNFETPNANRRIRRSQRKSFSTFKKRRKLLKKILNSHLNYKEERFDNILELNIKALVEKVSLDELCAIILNYNKWRGYNELDEDTIEAGNSDFKKAMKEVTSWCYLNNKTVSHFFNENKNIKRHSKETPAIETILYKKELTDILENQKNYHENLSDDLIGTLLSLIYYRKPIKSQKGIRSNCELEPLKKVTTKSNPHFQEFRCWEQIHNLRLSFEYGDDIYISNDILNILFNELNNTKELTDSKIIDIILKEIIKSYEIEGDLNDVENITVYNKDTSEVLHFNEILLNKLKQKFDGFEITTEELINFIFSKNNFSINFKKLKGNETKSSITSILGDISHDELYEIWNKIYSERTASAKINSLLKFGIDETKANKLSKVAFTKDYSSYSVKAIKKMIAYMNGEIDYMDSYNAREKSYPKKEITKDNASIFVDKIKQNELRNPIVEKVINHSIDIINHYIEKYGKIDEIRIELARELKNSSKLRAEINRRIQRNEELNKSIKELLAEHNINQSYKNVTRVKLWLEQGGSYDKKSLEETSKAECIYTGKKISIKDIVNFDIEHTIPKSVFYDNRINNLTLACPTFNKKKDSKTAIEAIENLPKEEVDLIVKRIDKYYKSNRNKKLLFFKKSSDEFGLPENQLNDTSYITNKLSNILKTKFNVIITTGKVTSFIRNEVGANDVLLSILSKENPNIEKVDKRTDNRHHALDSLIIALTDTSYIQKINTTSNSIDNIRSGYKNDGRFTDIVNGIKDDILSKFGYKSFSDLNKFFYNYIKNTIVSIEKEKDPFFYRNGCRGVRGALHEANPVKKFLNVIISNENSEIKFYRETKNKNKTLKSVDFKIEDIKSEFIKNLIYEYDNLEDAFQQNKYLNSLTSFKVKEMNDTYVLIDDTHLFKSGNNHSMVVRKENGKIKTDTVSLFDFVNNNHDYSNSEMVLRKKDNIILGYNNKEIIDMINNNDLSFIEQLYWVNKIDRYRLSLTPHNLNSNSESKRCILKSLNSINQTYGDFTKVKVNKYSEIIIQ